MKALLSLFLSICSYSALAEGSAPDPTRRTSTPTGKYIHKWIRFPTLQAIDLKTENTIKFSPSEGRMVVVFFIASWCEPCQRIIQDFKNIEARFDSIHTDFLYVFSHDTIGDAKGFAKEHGLKNTVLANHDILRDFHNPELPTAYFADRRGWLTRRFLKAEKNDTEELAALINRFSAL